MSSRINSGFGTRLGAALGAACIAFSLPGSLEAQQQATGWHAYFGCWQPVAAASSASPPGAPGKAVCIIPVEGATAIQFVTVFSDSVIDRLRINTSGDRIPASKEG